MEPSDSVATSELAVALEAARAGGEVLRRFFRAGVTVSSKADASLVSEADTEAERTVVQVIRDALPASAFLGEELHHAKVSEEHLWIIDPLDGTTNFVHGIPHFAVSVAYYRSGEPVCGVVYNPLREDLYVASRGGGALHNGAAVRVSTTKTLDQSLVGVGFYYDRGAMMESTLAAIHRLFRRGTHGIRRFGTASLDLCHVGTGIYDAFFEYELSPWDFAAGRLFVEEAGGRVTTCTNDTVPLGRTSILATNGLLHEAMLSVVEIE